MTTSTVKKMKPSEKKTWLKALRSGKFKQGKGQLCSDDRSEHCCLGVAYVAITGKPVYDKTAEYLKNGKFGLSEDVQMALACANDGDVDDEFKELGLPQPRLNNNGKASFNSIANWIEKYL